MKHIKKMNELVYSDMPLAYDVEKSESELEDFLAEVEEQLENDDFEEATEKMADYKQNHPEVGDKTSPDYKQWFNFIKTVWHPHLSEMERQKKESDTKSYTERIKERQREYRNKYAGNE